MELCTQFLIGKFCSCFGATGANISKISVRYWSIFSRGKERRIRLEDGVREKRGVLGSRRRAGFLSDTSFPGTLLGMLPINPLKCPDQIFFTIFDKVLRKTCSV